MLAAVTLLGPQPHPSGRASAPRSPGGLQITTPCAPPGAEAPRRIGAPPQASLLALTDIEILALRMAADGCVSGRLYDWPVLARAFRVLGWVVPYTVGLPTMRGLARAALAGIE